MCRKQKRSAGYNKAFCAFSCLFSVNQFWTRLDTFCIQITRRKQKSSICRIHSSICFCLTWWWRLMYAALSKSLHPSRTLAKLNNFSSFEVYILPRFRLVQKIPISSSSRTGGASCTRNQNRMILLKNIRFMEAKRAEKRIELHCRRLASFYFRFE